MQDTILPAFATPILSRVWPGHEGVNAELAQLVLAREPADPAARQSNVGGWHSEQDVLRWGGRAIEQLTGWIQHAVSDITRAAGNLEQMPQSRFHIVAWANVLRRGAYNVVHDHASNAWSGVYYVQAADSDPDQPRSGLIEFIDPRPAVNTLEVPGNPFQPGLRIQPQAGQMLVFPGWLRHYVHPYHGPGVRISIAFNVRLG